ncbi:MAG: O-antigen ligase family protein [Holophagales bacterium]|nr:O-antigen ligase family protein [Holophagales bacterium]
MGERLGRFLAPGAPPARWVLGAALAALAFVAIGGPHQRSGVPLLLASGLFFLAALARPDLATLSAAFVVALLPIAGNLLAGPWVAPAELLLLLVAGAALLRHEGTLPSPMKGALAISAAAMTTGAFAATLAALAPAEIPAAVQGLSRFLFSPGVEHAAFPLRAALVHAAGLLGFLLFRRVSARRGTGTLVHVVIGGLALVGAYAVLEASTGLKLWGAAHYEALSSGLRVPATLPDYNATGSAMALGLFPALVLARKAQGGGRLALLGAGITLLLAGLILSGSRGAWLATLAAAGAALAGALWSRRRDDGSEARRLVLGAGLAFVVSVAAIAAWPGDVGQLLRRRASTLVDPGASFDAVQAGRLGFWKAGARMVATHPFAGVGPGRAPARFEEFRDPSFPVRVENLHNYFLQALAENGLPGGLLVLLPFLPLALVAGRLLSTGAVFSSPEAALAPGLLAFSLTGFASHPWLLPELQFLFWGAASLLPVPQPPSGSPVSSETVRRFLPWTVLVLWGGSCLLLTAGAERGRFGYAEWGARGGEERYFWVGPRALVPVAVPGGEAVRVRIRGMLADLGRHPVLVSVQLDGGPALKVSLADRSWHDVVVKRGPFRPGKAVDGNGARGLLGLEASRSFCPGREKGGDRRVLALQLARPPLAPVERAAP